MQRLFLFLLLLSGVHLSSANEEGVNAVIQSWNEQKQQWINAYQAAPDAQKQAMLANKPNAAAYFKQLWPQLAPIINTPAAIPGLTWLMANKTAYVGSLTPEESEKLANTIYTAINTNLYDQYGIGQLTLYLVDSGTKGRDLLQKIRQKNINPTDQGLAALSLALDMRETNALYVDDPQNNTLRSQYVKEALLKAFDEPYGNATVKEYAQEIIYELLKLSTRRKAPSFTGKDDRGEVLTIPPTRPTLLVFWLPTQEPSVVFAKECAALPGKYPDLDVKCITRLDEPSLKNIKADLNLDIPAIADATGDIFKSYRVRTTPFVYLIDSDGIIRLRGVPDLVFATRLQNELAALSTPSRTQQSPSAGTPPLPQATPQASTTAPQPDARSQAPVGYTTSAPAPTATAAAPAKATQQAPAPPPLKPLPPSVTTEPPAPTAEAAPATPPVATKPAVPAPDMAPPPLRPIPE